MALNLFRMPGCEARQTESHGDAGWAADRLAPTTACARKALTMIPMRYCSSTFVHESFAIRFSRHVARSWSTNGACLRDRGREPTSSANVCFA